MLMLHLDYNRISPKSQTTELGEWVKFECFTITPTRWTFNDGNLPTNAMILDNRFLYIRDITVSNKGYYECEGSIKGDDVFYSVGILKVKG